MYEVSNSTTLIKLLSMNIFIVSLSACQSINPVGDATGSIASSDVESQFEGSILDPILDTMIGVFSGIHARGTIEDYIGDHDKQNIIKITRKAADTGICLGPTCLTSWKPATELFTLTLASSTEFSETYAVCVSLSVR